MSNKPSLHITMPLPRRLSEYQRISGAPRSPRFHEDFDAPFSEAIMNAQTPITPSCSDFSSSSYGGSPYQERPSMDDGSGHSTRRISPGSSLRTPSFPDQLSSASPCDQQQHEFPWNVPKPLQRKATVNDRVRGWARRSLMLRSRPTSPDEQLQHPTTTAERRVDPATTSKTTDVPK